MAMPWGERARRQAADAMDNLLQVYRASRLGNWGNGGAAQSTQQSAGLAFYRPESNETSNNIQTNKLKKPTDTLEGARPYQSVRFDPLAAVRSLPPTDRRLVSMGGQTYIDRDNGRANVLSPYVYVTNPPKDFDPMERRRSVNRIGFMSEHPLGAGAYGVLSAYRAPEWARDLGLASGALAEGFLGVGALKAQGAFAPPQFSPQPIWHLAGPRYMGSPGSLDSLARPNGLQAFLNYDTLRTGTKPKPSILPPGWSGNGKLFNEARGHLRAALLGGRGEDRRNLVTIAQNPTNVPHMRDFEKAVAGAVGRGEVVNYHAVPLYDGSKLVPSSILLSAHGSRGYSAGAVIFNSAAGRK